MGVCASRQQPPGAVSLTYHVLLGHGVLEDNDRGHNDNDPFEAVANAVGDRADPLEDHVGHLHWSVVCHTVNEEGRDVAEGRLVNSQLACSISHTNWLD